MSSGRRRGARAAAFGRAAAVYWLELFPLARRELRRWRGWAESIPDPILRHDALFTHRTKSRHSEGLAAFAVLAPAQHRPAVVRATVAFELILDYLDTISEQDSVDDSRQLHRAFEAAVGGATQGEGYYALHPHRDDGGYLEAQVGACRALVRSLPSYAVVAEALHRCAGISAEAQSLNHAIPFGFEEDAIAAWADGVATAIGLEEELRWWEMVAAGSSSVAIGALIAAAADPELSAETAAATESAYFPWATALSSLLDCLIDLGGDDTIANHLSRYSSLGEAGERLGLIASRSVEHASWLPQTELHEMVIAGIGGYYLAQSNAWLLGRERLAKEVLGALGPYARPALVVHCLRQRTPRSFLRSLGGSLRIVRGCRVPGGH